MRRIDLLSALETFVCAVEEGSLSQAARRLAKTPSAVTKAIAGLEATLGVQLLERTTRRLALTESGRLYLATATDVLRRLADGARQLSERDDEPRGLLRVTAAHSFGHAILAPLCAPFAQAFPRVRIELSLSDHYVDIVGEGFDLALRMGNYDLPSQIVKPIGSNRGLLCASPGYLARRGRPTAPADLAQHDCVIYRHPTLANTWTFERGGVRASSRKARSSPTTTASRLPPRSTARACCRARNGASSMRSRRAGSCRCSSTGASRAHRSARTGFAPPIRRAGAARRIGGASSSASRRGSPIAKRASRACWATRFAPISRAVDDGQAALLHVPYSRRAGRARARAARFVDARSRRA